jgi:hypothetical protein
MAGRVSSACERLAQQWNIRLCRFDARSCRAQEAEPLRAVSMSEQQRRAGIGRCWGDLHAEQASLA